MPTNLPDRKKRRLEERQQRRHTLRIVLYGLARMALAAAFAAIACWLWLAH
jgi:hypothetical protein